MAHESMLRFEEWHLFHQAQREGVRDVQTGERIFSAAGIQRVLGERGGCAGAAGGEDFTHVVQGLAVGVSGAHGELVKQVVRAEFRLNCLVIGIARVVAQRNHALIAVDAANGICVIRIGCGAGRDTRGNQVGELSRQIADEWIAIRRLEELAGVVANLANLDR